MIGIYKITSPSGKIYIGQSIDIKRRFRQYKSLLCKCQHKLYRSFLKYGYDCHVFEIIEECKFEELNDKERYYQELFDCIGKNGLNCTLVNTDKLKKRVTHETIEKIRLIHLGRVDSKEVRTKRALANTGKKRTQEQKEIISNSKKGKKQTEKHKNNISKSLKGYVKSKEHLENLSFSLKGRIVSQETRDKMSLIGRNRPPEINKKISNALKGKVLPADVRKKISLSNIGNESHKKAVKFAIEARKKKVICTDTNKIYESITECSLVNNINYSTLLAKLTGVNKNNTTFTFLL